MKKIISIILVILVLATGVWVYMNNRKVLEYNGQTQELSDQLLDYHSQQDALQQKIDEAWLEYDEMLRGDDCCFTLFVDNISSNLMDEVYPVISKYGYNATVVMNNFLIPGNAGCISIGDYNTLKNSGWDFAIGTAELDLSVENSEDTLDKYITEYNKKLTDAGFEMPKTICFGKGQFSKDYEDVIVKHGFNVVRHYEAADKMFSHGLERNGLYLLTTANICSGSTTMKKDMGTAYSKMYTYSATVRYVTDTDKEEDLFKDCSLSKYENMLRYIKNSCPDAKVFTATELYEYKKAIFSESEDFVKAFTEKMDRLEKELADAEKGIEELMRTLSTID